MAHGGTNGVHTVHQGAVKSWPKVSSECVATVRNDTLCDWYSLRLWHCSGSREYWIQDSDDEVSDLEADVEFCQLMKSTLMRLGLVCYQSERLAPLFIPKGHRHICIEQGDSPKVHFCGQTGILRQALMWCLCQMRGGMVSRDRAFNPSQLWHRLPDPVRRDLLFSMEHVMQTDLVPLPSHAKSSLAECLSQLFPVHLAPMGFTDVPQQQQLTRQECQGEAACDNAEFLGFFLVVASYVLSHVSNRHSEFLHVLSTLRNLLSVEQATPPTENQLFPTTMPLILGDGIRRLYASLGGWHQRMKSFAVLLIRVLLNRRPMPESNDTRVLYDLMHQFREHYILKRGYLKSMLRKPNLQKGKGSLELRSYQTVYGTTELLHLLMRGSNVFVADLARVHQDLDLDRSQARDLRCLVIHGTLPWEFISTVSTLAGNKWAQKHVLSVIPFYSKDDTSWCTAVVMTHWTFFLHLMAVRWFQLYGETPDVEVYSPVVLQAGALLQAADKNELQIATGLLVDRAADPILYKCLITALKKKDLKEFVRLLRQSHDRNEHAQRLTRCYVVDRLQWCYDMGIVRSTLGLQTEEEARKLMKDLLITVDAAEEPLPLVADLSLHAYYLDCKIPRLCLMSEALPILGHGPDMTHGSALLHEALHTIHDVFSEESKFTVSNSLRQEARQPAPSRPTPSMSQGTAAGTPGGFRPLRSPILPLASPPPRRSASEEQALVQGASAETLARRLHVDPKVIPQALRPSPYVPPSDREYF